MDDIGDRCRGRAEVGEGFEGGVRYHQRIFLCPSAALPSDAEQHLSGKELDHHLPDSDRISQPFLAQELEPDWTQDSVM